ncbi:hypothetical protein [Salinibacterium sp. ZJ70]|uniref:hypothetical protein n=1 Tax=Salinibacterium sp. ZJ70 TaxID=2708084 RepID=UPI00141DC649|nr:hypothetical protein [Salinibacterium sp. ZJ70]
MDITESPAGFLLIGAFIGALLCVPAVVSQYVDTRENVEYRCVVDGDHTGVEKSEGALIAAEVTAVPAGRKCTWRGESVPIVIEQTGEAVTTAALVGVGLVAIASVGLARRFWRVLIAPWVIAAGSWALILWSAR